MVAESAVCSIDPDEGVVMYRGYDIVDLAEHSTYDETAFLLLHGELPTGGELTAFEDDLRKRGCCTASSRASAPRAHSTWR